MNIEDYRQLAKSNEYKEVLEYIVGSEVNLKDFLRYEELDLDLKIHLTKVILCRHFSSTGGIALPDDIDWFITGFLGEFNSHTIKPWITGAVKESIEMIISGHTFTKLIIGMTFMFGVVEFYTKYRLGWRPDQKDPFDDDYHAAYRKIFLGPALNKLKKTNCDLAKDLNYIDDHSVSSLKRAGIEEKRYTKAKMADRLTLVRNTMLHGESHNFYDKGKYLVMIFILFHYHSIRDGLKYEGI